MSVVLILFAVNHDTCRVDAHRCNERAKVRAFIDGFQSAQIKGEIARSY